ncbi:MAG TPA: pyroglutamyl-peptidase I [Candidatus Obscuribacterales bacterium]
MSGFDAFDKLEYNPTQVVVESLPDRLEPEDDSPAIELTRLVLPTCCEHAWALLENSLAGLDGEPVILVATGLAQLRTRIELERFALNIRDYRIADNGGHQWLDTIIEEGGPQAIRTKLPLAELLKTLRSGGYACDISNHAGSFVCNDIYYRALRRLETITSPTAGLFVHFPLPERYGASNDSTAETQNQEERAQASREQTLGQFACALTEIIRFSCRWLRRSGAPDLQSASR